MALQTTIVHETGIELDAYRAITNIDLIAGIFEIRAYMNGQAFMEGKKALDVKKYQFSLFPTRKEEVMEYETIEPVVDDEGNVVEEGKTIEVGTGEFIDVENKDFIAKTGNPLEGIYILLKTKEEFKDALDV